MYEADAACEIGTQRTWIAPIRDLGCRRSGTKRGRVRGNLGIISERGQGVRNGDGEPHVATLEAGSLSLGGFLAA